MIKVSHTDEQPRALNNITRLKSCDPEIDQSMLLRSPCTISFHTCSTVCAPMSENSLWPRQKMLSMSMNTDLWVQMTSKQKMRLYPLDSPYLAGSRVFGSDFSFNPSKSSPSSSPPQTPAPRQTCPLPPEPPSCPNPVDTMPNHPCQHLSTNRDLLVFHPAHFSHCSF